MMDITIDDVRRLEPPAIYSYEPTREYFVHNIPSSSIEKYCGAIKEHIILGCTVEGHIIYIRNDLPEQVYDVILRHEKAHVNGWVHPNPRLEQLLRKLKGK
jgi:hypothetical protein